MRAATLTLSTAALTIAHDPGGRRFLPATLECRFANVSQINDQINLEVIGLPPEWVTRSLAGARLRPGMDSTAQITIHPPREPASTAGTRRFTVRVTSQEQPTAEPAEQSVEVTIAPFTETSGALVEPTRTAVTLPTVYQLRLRNGGNLPLTYLLSGAGDGLAVALAAERVTLAPGQETTVEARVAPSVQQGVALAPGAYPFTVRVEMADARTVPPEAPLVMSGTLVQPPPAPLEAWVEPERLELVDPVVTRAEATLRLRNPADQYVSLTVRAHSISTDYEVEIAPGALVLEPRSERAVTLAVRRAPHVPPTTTPLRQPVQIVVRQVDPPANLDPALLSAPLAAPGSVVIPPVPPVDVLIQPLGLRLDLVPPRQTGGRGRFRVVLANQGSQPAPVTLTVNDLEEEIRYAFGSRGRRFVSSRDLDPAGGGYTVVVAPGQQVVTPLEVRAPGIRFGGRPRRLPLRVTAAPAGQRLNGLTAEAEFEHRAPSRLLPLAGFGLVLASLTLGVALARGPIGWPGLTGLILAPTEIIRPILTPIIGASSPTAGATAVIREPTPTVPTEPTRAPTPTVLTEPTRPPTATVPTAPTRAPTPLTPPPPTRVVTPGVRPTPVAIPQETFVGGFRNTNRAPYVDGAGEARQATWIYGSRSDWPAMRATVRLASPTGPAWLEVQGMDDQASDKMQIQLTINGEVVFRGANPLPNNRWGSTRFPIRDGLLRPGDNVVEFSSLAPVRNFNEPPWLMISGARLVWDP